MQHKVDPRGKGLVFRNPILNQLTKSSPYIIVGMYVPVIVALLWYYHTRINASWLDMAAIFFGGALFWTFAEYLLHRYLFHFVNEKKWVQKFHYLAHGYHHTYPKDKDHLFMPPLPSIIMSSLFFGLYYLIMGKAAFAFLPGFIAGYLLYSLTHYAIHAIKPPSGFRYVWKHHNLHHFKYPEKAYGVSSPLWDYVFGTMPPKKDR